MFRALVWRNELIICQFNLFRSLFKQLAGQNCLVAQTGPSQLYLIKHQSYPLIFSRAPIFGLFFSVLATLRQEDIYFFSGNVSSVSEEDVVSVWIAELLGEERYEWHQKCGLAERVKMTSMNPRGRKRVDIFIRLLWHQGVMTAQGNLYVFGAELSEDYDS